MNCVLTVTILSGMCLISRYTSYPRLGGVVSGTLSDGFWPGWERTSCGQATP